MSHFPYIPKKVLIERVAGGAHSDTIRKVIDQAYAVADAACDQRYQARHSRDPGAATKLKQAVKERYGPQLVDIARPLAPLLAEVEAERKANPLGVSRETAALSSNLALANGALWCARKNLAPMAGIDVIDLEVMGLGQ